ncbi:MULTISPECIES: GTP 3',8-cyclase MoaA [unclassified Novosphingobium]|uniref:GTP 3',8-cyclase MoaA n=1 Tax=unclassified Novosphingobium TaxID=2644732 RepID=UPI00144704AA|nr:MULTISPECIES: GTP 3',8-cyclase MoaA [unclassified Novosphingobium]NKJ43299.1 cyclic pyranopterin phosphate synthase [Novosphingobium sp. SG720]NMN07009.1 cyclic pyranopterin phosphate synthase [Novosphingobium sp. SG919]NMN89403.1 cyclic pyranopterin phosphate synthase [Novosphingobium sp. SG916]
MNAPAPLVDRFARAITYLRLSVTDRCDLRCTYCMPERMTFLPRAEVLSLEELYRLSLHFIARGVTKLRLTGGEPLVRRDMVDLVRALGRHLGEGGLQELTLTTNGTRLAEFADDLAAAGVRRINVSLDTLDRARFAALARRDSLPQVLEGLAAARAAGLKVKLNAVALKGVNEDELPDLVAWAHGQGHDVTLIEVMPLGDVGEDRIDHYLPLDAVRRDLEQRWTLVPNGHSSGGPARYVDIAETGGRLGFITPLTGNFCATCNRVRVTATGQLYMCLGGEGRVDLRAALRSQDPDAALADAFARAMGEKQEAHSFVIDRAGAAPAVSRHMSMTGG